MLIEYKSYCITTKMRFNIKRLNKKTKSYRTTLYLKFKIVIFKLHKRI